MVIVSSTRLMFGGKQSDRFLLSMLWVGWFCMSSVHAESVAVPVHSLPYPCNTHGFPQVMDSGVLGCFKDGSVGLWMDETTQQTQRLPAGSWALGERLFQSGVSAGLWDIETETWAKPMRRISEPVLEGQLYTTKESVLWSDAQAVHHLDLETNQHRQRRADPVRGTHPISFGPYVAWTEWGEQMGVHLWSVKADRHMWIPSKYPSSLIEHRSTLVWVSEGNIVIWSSDTKTDTRTESGVQEVFSTEKGLCWTQWINDIDILCDSGFHFERLGHQRNPFWKGESLYFIESDTLWIYTSRSKE